jgi:hypothetical protein
MRVARAFDFSTNEILEWELTAIHEALIRQEIDITPHAEKAAEDENILLYELLEAILVGGSGQQRFTGKHPRSNSWNQF